MAQERLTDVQLEISKLNRQLQRIDNLRSDLENTNSRLRRLSQNFQDIQQQTEFSNSNNITVSWNGPSLKFTWATGYVKDKSQKVYPIPAGERTGLAVATYYWFAWNPVHQTMAVEQDLSLITAISNNIVLFRVHSGDAGTTATAGGGGNESGGSDLNGGKYAVL